MENRNYLVTVANRKVIFHPRQDRGSVAVSFLFIAGKLSTKFSTMYFYFCLYKEFSPNIMVYVHMSVRVCVCLHAIKPAV